jgi:hypothetical protein
MFVPSHENSRGIRPPFAKALDVSTNDPVGVGEARVEPGPDVLAVIGLTSIEGVGDAVPAVRTVESTLAPAFG